MGERKEDNEWEEQYVFVELVGMVDPDKLHHCTVENCNILGVDDEMTVLKLGSHVFAGEYEDALGTMVFLEETEHEGGKYLKYNSHTCKILKTSRAFLKLKPSAESGSTTQK